METPETMMSLIGKGRRSRVGSRHTIGGITTIPSVAPRGDDRAGLERQQCNQAMDSARAPLADTCVGKGWLSSSSSSSRLNSNRHNEAERWQRIQPRKRRSVSFIADHEKATINTIVAGQQPVAGSGSSTPTTRLSILLESAFRNLTEVIAEFQQGVRAADYTDGDLAAQNGHMHLVTHVASVFSDQAMVRAAAQGHLDMIKYLHRNRKEGTTAEAMDLAATCGHLDVVEWLHNNRTEGCTTRAMDGAARNAHIHVRLPRSQTYTTCLVYPPFHTLVILGILNNHLLMRLS